MNLHTNATDSEPGQRRVGGAREQTPGPSAGSSSGRTSTALPTLSLPKGGGAIRGIGEKFAANPVTGTGSMSVPIATSPGRSGFGPELSLSYDSGAGNGPFGFGWSLSLPAITRKTDKGLPQYRDAEESDVFILSGAEDLVPQFEQDAAGQWVMKDGEHVVHDKPRTVAGVTYSVRRYRPRIEGLFARIERWTNVATGETHWRSITRDNVTTLYGTDNDSRIFDPGDPDPEHPTRVFSWLIRASYDDKGNAILYEYAAENDDYVDRSQPNERNRVRTANRYLKRIRYGNRQPNRDAASWVASDPAHLPEDTWMFEAVFDYDEAHYEELNPDPPPDRHRFVRASASAGQPWSVRPDPFSFHRAGFEVRSYRRCRRVLMFHHIPDLPTGENGYDGLVRSTEFDYADLDYSQPVTIEEELAFQASTRFASFIRSVTQSGYVRDDAQPEVVLNGVPYATYLKKSLPPLEFEYSKVSIQDEVLEADAESLENLPVGLDGSDYRWVDLDGEGVSGILTEQADAWFYKPNLGGGRFGPLETVAAKPSLAALADDRQQLLDLAGDGQLDLVALDGPTPGFYERTFDQDWAPFRLFRELPSVSWDDPNLRFIDLDGDGHADVLITEEDVFTWYPSLAEEGFGPARQVRQPWDEERGPRLVFADGSQSVYLADMCGDGLTDLARVRNGEVCFWPNLGYGRFGAKVTMDNAPWFDHPDQFDQRRVRLGDTDGSGTTDVIYLHRDGPHLYFNQAGNRLSEARRLDRFPRLDDVSSVTTADLLGNGTACLVWSSPLPGDARRPLRYVDLMGGTKPHLLVRSVNNLGAETEVHYAPSTSFYLEDKRKGRPWVTRLPFPVHVVERVVTHDRISGNRFVTRYAYHHGYFDGTEREFRGFGMVEQWDTEELAVLTADGTLPEATNIDASSHVPPVLTKTWFHTGKYLGRDHVSDFFAGLLDAHDTGEYFREPGLTNPQARDLLLDDTILPPGLTADEDREACRALRGSLLRQEVYALDDSDRQTLPYAVTERNYGVKRLQGRGDNRHAVFLTHSREEVVYNYERMLVPVLGGQLVDAATAAANPNVEWLLDPRVAHSVTLEVDDFGNVLKAASIGYDRRFVDPSLPQAAQDEQAKTNLTYTEYRVTNSVDSASGHRTPLVYEARTYELTGYLPTGAAGRFRAEDLVLPTPADPTTYDAIFDDELEYEERPTGGRQRRLIEHVRTVFRRDDLVDALPLGQLESMALPFETYKLALTPGLVRQLFNEDGTVNRVSEAMLDGTGATPGGRYVHARDEGGVLDANWWIPSGRVFFSLSSGDTAAQELNHARNQFFLPHRARDPFHTAAASTESFVEYDDYDLMVRETRDALDNRVTVGERHQDPTQALVESGQDYRVLQPALVMDPNRNRTAIAFDALGMVAGTAVMGKPEDNPAVGDRLTPAFRPDLTQAELDGFLAAPKGPIAAQLLAEATSRVITDLTAYSREPDPAKKPPAFAASLARETHVSEPLPPGGLRIQTSFSYSDGFGREVQKKVQAEPGPVPVRDANGDIVLDANNQPQLTPNSVSPRWVGSGWTVFNNKGKPVRQYEPYFTHRHRFEFDVRIGKSPVLFYDPVARVVATLHPNRTWEKVVFGPWREVSWDVSDTVLVAAPETDADVGDFFARLPAQEYTPTWHALRTDATHAAILAARYPDANLRGNEQAAARQSEIYARTPTLAHADSLGRTIVTVAHNRVKYSNAAEPPPEFHATRVVFDIEGNERQVIDAKDRIVVRYEYDMLGNRIHQSSMEAGKRWTLSDVAGKALYAWDSRSHRFGSAYDVLQRPTESFLLEGAGPEVLLGRSIYGESRANPEANNLRTKVVELFDQAGVVTSDRYDFQGNLLSSARQLVDTVPVNGQPQPAYKNRIDWNAPVTMAAEKYVSQTRFDALNRPIQLVAPHSDQAGANVNVNVIQPAYNDANLLERIDVWLDHGNVPGALIDPAAVAPSPVGVANIDYDAQAQRQRIEYKNGVSTRYSYDLETFRLVHLHTEETGPGRLLQNLHYTFDVAGNITHIRDTAQQTVFFANARVEPSARYSYDALFRLIEATGREHLGQAGGAPIPHSYNDAPRVGRAGIPHPNDGQTLGRYIERYFYDQVGNISTMRHAGTDPQHPGWTRNYAYNESSQVEPSKASNRLASTTVGNGAPMTATYSNAGDGYDPHGNMLKMPQLQVMQWNERDQLQMTQRQAVNQTDADGVQRQGERTWYVYDAGGQRIRKVTELANGQVKDERLYLGGFEVYRKPADNLVRETLHIMDDKQRIAMVETRTHGNEVGIPPELVHYQLANHLGTACLEVDDRARVLSYEEYTSYGSTAYQSVRSQIQVPKRYRFTGMERDEESGLSYHSARYYAPWLGRWTNCDPAGFVDSTNLYQYATAGPVGYRDQTGLGPDEQALGASMEKASKKHQDAVNQVREGAGMKPVKVDRQVRVGDDKTIIADELKVGPKGTQKVVDTKARHVASVRNTSASQRTKDIRANLEQVKEQLAELQRAGKIDSSTKGAALRVIHDSDKGASSTQALSEWRAEAKAVRQDWIDEATDPVEKALRQRVGVSTTTRARYAKLTKAAKGAKRGGAVGKGIAVGFAAYVFFKTGDAWAAVQTANPLSNVTDVLASDDITVVGVTMALARDAYSFTPLALTDWVLFDLLGPQGDNYYSQKLADRALSEGRNPFCAQCHGPGGALDPNNEWNRARQWHRFDTIATPMAPSDLDVIAEWMRSQAR